MQLTDLKFINEIKTHGGEIYSVGGAVRDEILGVESKDLDVLITGIPMDKLELIVSKYGRVDAVGKSFGVLKFIPTNSNMDVDIAIPRTEKPTGEGGHKGFEIISDHSLPIEEDLFRRDFTINAIANDVNGNIIDPFDGVSDVHDHIIRVVNPNSFSDDPLRMVRAIQFCARFEMCIETQTEELIKSNAHRISEITGERILEEFKKVITKKGDPLYAADLLRETGLYTEITSANAFDKIWSLWWDMDAWEHIETFGEFMFLLLYPTGNAVGIFRDRLKGDTDTLNEITALCMAYDSHAYDLIDIRYDLSLIFKKSAGVIQSKILPSMMVEEQLSFNAGKYPLSVSGLDINGNDLMGLGYEGREIGDALQKALKKIYADEVLNNKKDLLNLFRK